jgi:hypothetical protein
MQEEVLYRGRRDDQDVEHVYAVREGVEFQLDSRSKQISWGYSGTGPRQLVELIITDYYRDDPKAHDKRQVAEEVFRSLANELTNDTGKWEWTRRDIEFALLDRPLAPTRQELLDELLAFDNEQLIEMIRHLKRENRRWVLARKSVSASS